MASIPAPALHYLNLFKVEADSFFQNWPTLPVRYEFFQRFREREYLEKAEWRDFQALNEHLHTFSSLRLAGARALGEPNHPNDFYRTAFIHLFYGKEPLVKRFDRFKSGVAYFGEGTVSELLQWCFPEQFLNINDRAVRAVDILGVEIAYKRGSSSGEKFKVFNEKIKSLLDAYLEIVGLRTATTVVLEFDAFCYWLTENFSRLPKPQAFPKPPQGIRFWLLAPGRDATEWDAFFENGYAAIGWPETGDLRGFTDKEKIAERLREVYGDETNRRNDALACWQFAHEIKPGDIVIAKKGLRYYLGWGVVGPNGYRFDDEASEKFKHRRDVEWQNRGLFPEEKGTVSMKTLTEITPYPDYVQRLMKLLGIEVDESGTIRPKQPALPDRRYTIESARLDANLPLESFEKMLQLLDRRRQIILQGAPGTGKTYLAKILQRYLTDATDDQADIVQFHPSYAYEDFVEGYRPITGGGAELKPGIFRLFCEKAQISHKARDGKKYVLLLDEINRGNLAKIFGELLYLLEYRNERVKLAYRPDEDFHIPENVYLIGTMNTADRSLSLVDYALRRRFSFVTLRPDYELIKKQSPSDFSWEMLANNLQGINRKLSAISSLGEGFAIGHSYFVNGKITYNRESLNDLWDFDLHPLLAEYFLDDESQVSEYRVLFFNGL